MKWICTFHGGPLDGYTSEVGPAVPAPDVPLEMASRSQAGVTVCIWLYHRTTLTETTATYHLMDVQSATHNPQEMPLQ